MIINYNSTDIPDDFLREIYSFVRPNLVKSSEVMITLRNSSRGSSGHSVNYPENSVPCYTKRKWKRHQIVISLVKKPRKKDFPTYNKEPKNNFVYGQRRNSAGKLVSFKHKYSRGGYLHDYWILDRTEDLVHLMAHEIRHAWQSKKKRGYRVWGSKGQYSERDCDAYAIRMLRKWRKAHLDLPKSVVDFFAVVGNQ